MGSNSLYLWQSFTAVCNNNNIDKNYIIDKLENKWVEI